MKSYERQTLAQIAVAKPAAAAVFEKYELDYCCHGMQTMLEACEHDMKKYDALMHDLEDALQQNTPENLRVNFEALSPEELIDYIVSHHHSFVKKALPHIRLHLQKTESKHGLRHPLLREILRQFDQLSIELENHMFKEEEILFPRIRKINEFFVSGKDYDHLFNVRMVSDPISLMMKEHEIAGSLMAIIHKLTDNYQAPNDACNTFFLTYHELREFEADLHQHMHLENNILFPKAKVMIDKMVAQA